jgi:hypothetical protein
MRNRSAPATCTISDSAWCDGRAGRWPDLRCRPNAPKPDAKREGEWRFDPPSISLEIVEHFAGLLRRLALFNAGVSRPILLLPVLIDFHFSARGALRIRRPDPDDPMKTVQNPDWVKQGRADALTKTAKRRKFLNHALELLLQASRARADVIYAWERWHPDRRRDHPVQSTFKHSFRLRIDTRISPKC